MKTYLFRLFFFLSCFHVSCGSDSPENNETPENDRTLPFRYSIILKDKDGLVLVGGERSGPGPQNLFYFEEDIRLIPYSPDGYQDPLFSIRGDDGQESRIVVATEFNECRGSHVTMILELVEVRVSGPEHLPFIHKYTYDTIRCDLKVLSDSVICEKILINEIPSWENNENRKEDPCITLIKKHHTYSIGGLE
jgi:hypothetical protein